MGMLEILSLLSCKNGDELFERVGNILSQYAISMYNDDGSAKDLYALCCDVADVLNKGK